MKFIDPLVMYKCPFCQKQFHPGDCAIVSRVTTGIVLHPPPQTQAQKLLSRVLIRTLGGTVNTRQLAALECPNCRKALPYNIGRVRNITIAIIGDLGSGKSHQIAATVYQLKEGQMHQINQYVRMTCLTPDIERRYIDPIFKDKRVLSPNQQATDINPFNETLIYELVMHRAPLDQRLQRINLILHDASGEDIANQDRLVQFARYILNADGIIFLADPLTMPGIVSQLPAYMQGTLPTTPRRTFDVLNSVIQVFEMDHNLEPGSRLPIPIAITLSKSDLLQYVGRPVEPYRFLTDPIYDGRLDIEDVQKVDGEVKDLIKQFGDRSLLRATAQFARVSFFAVSATSFPADQGTFPDVKPRRCLDPLLWIFAQLGIIEAIPRHTS